MADLWVGFDPAKEPGDRLAPEVVDEIQIIAQAGVDSVVGSADLEDGAVTTAKIADLAVTDAKLASNSVTTSKIAGNAISSDKLGPGSVTPAKAAPGIVTSEDVVGNDLEMVVVPITAEQYAALPTKNPNYLFLITDGNSTVEVPGGGGGGGTGGTGPQGPAGPAGPQGPAGADGAPGPAGPEGPQGQQGVQGAPGLGIRFKGEVASVAELPTTGQVQGDLWTIGNRTDPTTPAEAYVWDETTADWVYAGFIQGPQGVEGPAGSQGPKGDPGADGAPGVDGAAGPQGPAGDKGDQGDTGAQGPAGADGAKGDPGADGAPGATGPAGPSAVSADADNATTLGTDGLIYTPLGGGAVGPQGPAGPEGPAGPAGADGAKGDTGPAGADGADGADGQQGIQGAPGLGIRYVGEVATVAELPATGNVQGDLWVIGNRTDDTQPAESYIWDEGQADWVYGGRIQGPQGVPGVAGPKGDQGDPGADGAVGPAGADGAPGADGAVGPAGPSAVSADAGNASVLGTDGLVFTPAGGGGGLVTAPSVAGFPAAGETGKVYLAEDSGDTFRFDATARGTDTYVRISETTLSTKIEDSTEVGRALVTAVDALAARQTIAAAPVGKTVFVQDYRDGVLTDNEILDAAFADLEAGGEIRFEQGVTYTLTATCAPDLTAKPGVVINGQGATLTGAIQTLFSPKGTAVTGARPTLTAAVTSRSKTLKVSSTAAFQPGDLINLYSDAEQYDPDSGTGGEVKSEVAEIRTVIDATTIELEGRTWNTYSLTGFTVAMAHYRPMRDVTVKDLTLQSADRITLERVGLAAYYFVGLTFSNVTARGFTVSGIYSYGGINVNYLNCHVTECSVERWTDYGVGTIIGANGYGMWVQSVVGSKFIGCFGRRNRHTIDTHAAFDMLMMGCTGENDRSASFSTHGVSTTKIIGCTARESGGGIVVRGTNNTIIGNQILGIILDADAGGQSYGTGIVVGLSEGNRGGLCGTNLIIENNFIDISGYTVTKAATAGNAIWLNSPAINARISGNIIRGFTNSAISVRPILPNDGLEISNNLIDVSGQQGPGISDGPVNRAAIALMPKSGITDASTVYCRNVNIVDNLVTAGVPLQIVYMRGGSSTGGRGERIRIIGNRSAQSCTAQAVYLQEYFGAGVEVWGNEVPASGEVFHNGAFFSSPLIGSPTFRSIELGAADTTLSRSAAGVLAVEGIAVPTISSTSTLTNKTLTNPKVNNIYDTSGAVLLGLSPVVASAVNYLAINNAAAGSGPLFAAGGSDTNVSMNFRTKGNAGYKFLVGGAGTEFVALAPNTDPAGVQGRLAITNAPISDPRASVTIASIATAGAKPNADLNLTTEGTGTVRANNVPVVTGTPSGLTTTALSLWTGTKAQYDAIVTKSATTIYVVSSVAVTTGDIMVDEGAEAGDITAEPVAEEPATRSATTKSTRKK